MNVLLTTGRQLGAGLQFDGIDDFVSVGNIPFTSETYSFSFLARIDDLTLTRTLFTNTLNSSLIEPTVLFFFNSNTLTIQKGRGTGNTTRNFYNNFSNRIIPNAVNHFTVVYTNTLPQLFINGILSTPSFTISSGTASIISTNPTFVGRDGFGGLNFQGIIYDLKIFNKALTQAEVQYLYLRSNVIIPPTATSNVIANWRFNQKTGTTLIDRTGAWNGTLTNFTNTTPSVGNAWVDSNGNSITA